MKHPRELWNSRQSKIQDAPADNRPMPRGPAPQIQSLFSDLIGRMAIRGFQLLILGLVAACIFWGLLQVTTIVIHALIATILACALWPLVARARKHLPNLLTAWTVFLSALLVLGWIGAGVVASVLSQWDELAQQAQRGFAQLGQWSQQLLDRLPFDVGQQRIDGMLQSAGKLLTSSEVGSGALHTLGAAGEVATGAVLLLVVLFFFFLKDGDRIWAFIPSWTQRRYRAKWIASGDQALRTFGGYVRRTAIVATVDAVGITAALLILRVPLALPLGVIVFLGSFIPLVGATVAGTLSVLVALVASGPASALIILAVVVGVNQLEGHFLQPVVMADDGRGVGGDQDLDRARRRDRHRAGPPGTYPDPRGIRGGVRAAGGCPPRRRNTAIRSRDRQRMAHRNPKAARRTRSAPRPPARHRTQGLGEPNRKVTDRGIRGKLEKSWQVRAC